MYVYIHIYARIHMYVGMYICIREREVCVSVWGGWRHRDSQYTHSVTALTTHGSVPSLFPMDGTVS